MLSSALVLLVASSAFATPPSDNGGLISSYMINGAFKAVDDDETCNIHILTIKLILSDFANQTDANSQALAVSQTIAALGELATGTPGDSCEAAAVANAVASSNAAAIKQAVSAWIERLQRIINLIVEFVKNPQGFRNRNSTEPRSNCNGAGRTYQLEAAWNAVQNATSSDTLPLVNEEYYAAKRLYNAVDSRSNNVGAAVTAASVPQVVGVVQRALGPAVNLLRAVATGLDPRPAAAIANAALAQAANA